MAAARPQPVRRGKSRGRQLLFLAALTLCLLLLAAWWKPAWFLIPPAEFLVRADKPAPSDCIFVLAGDRYGQRILKAGALYRAGLARKVFVSGPTGYYDASEDDLAIEFARRRGMTDVPFIGWKNEGLSTQYEARFAYPRLKREGCRSVMVVTSDFHTRRAGRLMRRHMPDLAVRIISAPTEEFDSRSWWTLRHQQKTVFLEWSKTFAEWFGI